MEFTKKQHEEALRIIEQEDLVLVCNHVLDQTRDAEYRKEDDSYVCLECRGRHAKCGKECKCIPYLSMVHRSCLGV